MPYSRCPSCALWLRDSRNQRDQRCPRCLMRTGAAVMMLPAPEPAAPTAAPGKPTA